MKSTISLFKALPIKTRRKKKAPASLLEKTVKRGFVFSPEVVYNYSNYDELIGLVEEVFGITSEKINSSFHKSWKKVKEADIEQLVLEQIVHYITTYGFERLGIYDENSVYIPKEKLEIPDLDTEGIRLIVIKGYTKNELKTKLLKLLDSGIALKEETINDVVDIALFVELKEKEIRGIKNRETKVILYDYLNLVPENPVEFLRYIVYKATDKTLLIKSSELIELIREHKNINIIKLFNDYDKKYGIENLAKIFYRFKPIFLAFKTNRQLSSIINRIRRLAVHYHKPLPEDYLNEVTAKIKKGEKIDKLEEELEKVNTFRKVRLAYALKFRTKDIDAILYKIRSGKGYVTDFNFNKKSIVREALGVVLKSIAKDISKNVKGKKIYIPEYINYALPATEKQFIGNLPAGTYITIPQDMIVGVHWGNVKEHRIDLDLSLISQETGKIGWDSSYRTEDRGILFSGDVTTAPKPRGASELFYVKRQSKNGLIVFLNYYNYNEKVAVPFKIIVAKQKLSSLKKNYMVNPNDIVLSVQSEINKKQKILGLLITTTGESRFYFVETSIGKSITSLGSELAENSRKYLMGYYQNSIELGGVLLKAGAKIVTDEKECDIDLSPENIERDTIINLLR